MPPRVVGSGRDVACAVLAPIWRPKADAIELGATVVAPLPALMIVSDCGGCATAIPILREHSHADAYKWSLLTFFICFLTDISDCLVVRLHCDSKCYPGFSLRLATRNTAIPAGTAPSIRKPSRCTPSECRGYWVCHGKSGSTIATEISHPYVSDVQGRANRPKPHVTSE